MVKDVSWTMETETSGTLTVDGISETPDFVGGTEITLTLVFQQNRQSTYDTLTEYGEYLYDGAVEMGTDYREVPYYKEYVHPQATYTSHLWKLVPSDSILGLDGWWVVVTDVEDDTLYADTPRRVITTVFTVAPADEGDRTTIEDRYGVQQ